MQHFAPPCMMPSEQWSNGCVGVQRHANRNTEHVSRTSRPPTLTTLEFANCTSLFPSEQWAEKWAQLPANVVFNILYKLHFFLDL